MKRSSDAYEWEIQGDCSNGVNSTTYFNSETSSLCFALLSAIIRFQPKKIFTLSWAFSRWLEKLKSCWKKIAFDSLSEKIFRFFFLSSTLGEIEKHNLSTLHVKFPLNSFLMIKTKKTFDSFPTPLSALRWFDYISLLLLLLNNDEKLRPERRAGNEKIYLIESIFFFCFGLEDDFRLFPNELSRVEFGGITQWEKWIKSLRARLDIARHHQQRERKAHNIDNIKTMWK